MLSTVHWVPPLCRKSGRPPCRNADSNISAPGGVDLFAFLSLTLQAEEDDGAGGWLAIRNAALSRVQEDGDGESRSALSISRIWPLCWSFDNPIPTRQRSASD